jgi:hypothetical protein
MGCDPIPLPGGGTAILCNRGQRRKPCYYCGRPSSFACGRPVIRKGQRTTCDVPMCNICRNEISPGVDLCRAHFNHWQNNGRKFMLGDVEVQP